MSDINVDTPGASGANPTATASDVAVNGSAATFMRSDGAPAVQKTSASIFGLCKVDGSTITASGGVITAVPGGGGVGNVTGPASSTDTAIATWNGTAGTALRNNSATLIDTSGNISTTGKFSATGNVSGGNLTTAGVVSATGNVSGGNLTTAGLISATGNVSGGNLTTAGNVTGANIGNITPTNLNGNGSTVLLGNGTFGVVPGGSGGALTLLGTVTTTGSAGNITFSSIPSSYTHLEIEFMGRGSQAALSIDIRAQFNGDTGNNYSFEEAGFFGTSATPFFTVEGLATSSIRAFDITAGNATANYSGSATFKINGYAQTTFFKPCHTLCGHARNTSTGGQIIEFHSGIWLSTTAINAIKLFPSAGNFVDGTIASLYGKS